MDEPRYWNLDELRAAIGMVEFVDLAAVARERASAGAPASTIAQIERWRREAAQTYLAVCEQIKRSAGQDPAQWGPYMDRVLALAATLQGRHWRAGWDAAPAGVPLH